MNPFCCGLHEYLVSWYRKMFSFHLSGNIFILVQGSVSPTVLNLFALVPQTSYVAIIWFPNNWTQSYRKVAVLWLNIWNKQLSLLTAFLLLTLFSLVKFLSKELFIQITFIESMFFKLILKDASFTLNT